MPRPALEDANDQELNARLKRTERDLYWSRHEDRGKPHDQFEREWNELKAEQARRRNETWTYKHDRRNEFTFEKKESVNSQGEARTTTTATGRAHDPDTTIRWRSDTQYGRNRYNQIQRAARRSGKLEEGHDLGHLAADEHGVDPEGVNAGEVNSRTRVGSVDRPNYTSQGGRTNEHAGWRTEEARVTEAGRTAPVDYTVTSVATDKRGLHREQSRTMVAQQEVDGKTVTVSDSKLVHGGFDDHAKARERAEQAAARQQNANQGTEVEALKAKVQSHANEKKAGQAPAVNSTQTKDSAVDQARSKNAQQSQSKTQKQSKSKPPQ